MTMLLLRLSARAAVALSLVGPLSAHTRDLLVPENRKFWLTCTEKAPPVVFRHLTEPNRIELSRPGATFNPTILFTHFGKDGLISGTDRRPPEVTLAKVGETVGLRMVFSYNADAAANIAGACVRIGLANSNGTRPESSLVTNTLPVFEDDQGWGLFLSVDKVQTAFWRRPPHSGTMVPTSTMVKGKVEVKWPNPIPRSLAQPDAKIETIFSLTRTGPTTLKLYGFMGGVEQEHEAQDVADFSFDSLYLHYTGDRPKAGAVWTIHELQLMTP